MSRGALVRNFADMPLVLKGITSFFGVFGVATLVAIALPGLAHRIGDATLATGELWRGGYGTFGLAMGLWLVVLAGALLRRAGWACVGTLLAYAPLVLAEARLAEEPRVLGQALWAAAWAGGCGAYLFRTRGARAYFSRAAA